MLADSSVLIYLAKIGKLNLLQKFGKIKISDDVYRKTVTEGEGKTGAGEIKDACKTWIEVVNLEDKVKVKAFAKVEGIEEGDASLIFLAKELGETIVSNDYALLMVARSRGIDNLWFTTLLLSAVKKKLISKNEGKKLLLSLVEVGMFLKPEVYASVLQKIDSM